MSVEETPALESEVTAETAEDVETLEQLTARLDQLKASATQQYSLKNYDAAAEFFSEAAEVQDKLNGEMSLDNADLLYQYGRCLYHVAVANSDVLGGKVAGAEEPKRKKRKVAPPPPDAAPNGEGSSSGVVSDALKTGDEKLAENVVEAIVEEKDGIVKAEEPASKPYFQITGDENFTDSEDDDEDPAEAEEEEDDFATAFEVLDMARILLTKKLQALATSSSPENAELRHLKERLADTHDLQAEISLENERFHEAINDTRNSLQLKIQLYPPESSLIAEAYFKLSLALEFASVTSTTDENDAEPGSEQKIAQVDEEMRAQAATEMEKAIASCRLRIEKEEALLPDLAKASAPESQAKHAEIQAKVEEVKEMVLDMEQRLLDLGKPAVSLRGPTGFAGDPLAGQDDVKGILNDLLGETKAEKAKRIAEATENANDLTSLVKQRKKPKADVATNEKTVEKVEGKGKRKADDGDGASAVGGANGKKVKFENGA